MNKTVMLSLVCICFLAIPLSTEYTYVEKDKVVDEKSIVSVVEKEKSPTGSWSNWSSYWMIIQAPEYYYHLSRGKTVFTYDLPGPIYVSDTYVYFIGYIERYKTGGKRYAIIDY